jgi:hypothetical protein
LLLAQQLPPKRFVKRFASFLFFARIIRQYVYNCVVYFYYLQESSVMNRSLLAKVAAAHVHRLIDPYGTGPLGNSAATESSGNTNGGSTVAPGTSTSAGTRTSNSRTSSGSLGSGTK